MTQWWEIETTGLPGAETKFRAVAYYRHSAQDRQENSIPIQRDQVREWAQNGGRFGAAVGAVEEDDLALVTMRFQEHLQMILRAARFGENQRLAPSTGGGQSLEAKFKGFEQSSRLSINADSVGPVGESLEDFDFLTQPLSVYGDRWLIVASGHTDGRPWMSVYIW